MMPHTFLVGSQQPRNCTTSSQLGSATAGNTQAVLNAGEVPRKPQRSAPSNVTQHGMKHALCSNSPSVGQATPPHSTGASLRGSQSSGERTLLLAALAVVVLPADPALPLIAAAPAFALAGSTLVLDAWSLLHAASANTEPMMNATGRATAPVRVRRGQCVNTPQTVVGSRITDK